MRKLNRITHTAVLLCVATASGGALSAPLSLIQKLNGVSVTAGAQDLGNNRMLTITGYAGDLDAKDPGTVSSIIIKNVENGNVYTTPVLRRIASLDALVASGPGTASATAGKLINAGFLGILDSYTLPAGNYEVSAVTLKTSGAIVASTVSASQKGYFSIPVSRVLADVQIIGPDGTPVSVALTPSSMADNQSLMRLTGYPALRNGTYTVKATARNKYGRISKNDSIAVQYIRPVVKADIAVPRVDNFPGLTNQITLNNPLDKSPLNGTLTGKIILQSATVGQVSVQGVDVTTAEEKSLAIVPKLAGRYQVTGSATGSRGTARIWIEEPDAPDVELSIGNWSPDDGIQLTPSRDAYAPALDAVQVTASAVSGSSCTSVYGVTADSNITGEYQQPVCAVKYKTLPQGVAQEASLRANLRGALQTDGVHPIEFETGVLWTNPDTKATSFYKSKDRSFNLTGILPKEPDISFNPIDKLLLLAKASPGKNLTYTGQTTAGRVTVTGKYPGMTLTIKVGDADPKLISTNNTSVREFLNTTAQSLWQTQDVVIESWYNKYPEKKFTKTLTFTAIPKEPVVVLGNIEVVSTEDTVVRGNLGVFQGGVSGFAYVPAESGSWTVQLYEEDTKGNRTALGDPVDVIEQNGAFSVNLGRQAPGRRNIVAVGRIRDAVDGVSTQQISSMKVSMYVKDGSILAGSITSRQASGPVPFTPSLGITLQNSSRTADIGHIEWYRSIDGVGYEKITGNTIGLRPEMKESGKAWFKAKITNRHSSLIAELDPFLVHAFAVPKVTITGDTATFVNQAVTLTAQADISADYTWYVSQSATDKTPQVITGTDTITVTPTAPSNMLIKVVASETNSPADNAAKNASATTSLRAVLPSVQRPMIFGPGYVETGKQYEFKAIMTPLFNKGLQTSLKLKGQWKLPDGSTQEGDTLSYTIQGTDKALRYEVWVDGLEDVKSAADFGLRSWTYSWPDWIVVTRVVDNRVPATLRFQVFPRNASDIQKLGGEKPSYVWQFPESFRVVATSAESATVEANEPGEFQAVATVSDSRGNTTQATSNIIQIAPAPDLIPDLVLQSGDKWNRAPNKVYARVNLLSVPKNDIFASASFKLDGAEVASGSGIAAYIDVPSPGLHEVTTIVRSAGGKVGTTSKTIELGTGDNPVCQLLQYGDGTTTLSLTAKCTVQQGTITSYRWTVNGVQMPSSSYMLSFAKKDIDAGISSVAVTVMTDKGQEGTASWSQ